MAGKKLFAAYRGCMAGALIGDCLGSPFEGELKVTQQVGELFDKLASNSQQRLYFTDDTAMTWDIASSLLRKRRFDGADMATSFRDTYYNDSDRGYGSNVIDVFAKWKQLGSKTRDCFLAAREQFKGQGSYGNGGAMRISPVALFAINDYDTLLQVARDSTLLTHTHPDGVCGALVQAIALWQVIKHVQSCSDEAFDSLQFIDELIDRVNFVETATNADEKTYVSKLNLVKEFLSTSKVANDEEIIESLGNSISAPKSVPTAIYCFLRHTTIGSDETTLENGFEQTVRYAVCLGGDTDTIASMAGSLAGAYYGIDRIPKYLKDPCEDFCEAISFADKLHELVCK